MRGLTDRESALVNAKLLLLLANHIGDPDVLAQAMAVAREGVGAARKGAGEAQPPQSGPE